MREIGSFEAKTHLSRLLHEVDRKKEGIWITRHGIRVACLLPENQVEGNPDTRRVVDGLREVREQQSQTPKASAKDWISEGRKR